MKTYVLVQTADDAPAIAWELQDIPGIERAEDVRGPYDAIVMAGSDERPLEAVLRDIRRVPGVTRALTAPIIGSFAGVEDPAAA